MSETQGSFPEEQDESAHAEANAPGGHEEFARTLEHDARTPLGIVSNSLQIVEMGLPPDHPLNEVVTTSKTWLENLSTMLKEAVDREPLPEMPLGKIHPLIAAVLRRMCEKDPHLAGRCVFTEEAAEEEIPEECGMRILLRPLPEELRRSKIPCSQSALERIFDNLVKNSLRKGARNMVVALDHAGYHRVSLSVSDDGEGMKLRILRNLRSGIGDTDKSDEDGISPGGTADDHGRGIQAVRQIVMKRSSAEMDIFSVKKDGVEDPEGDAQDEHSVAEHPFGHGVTYRFTYRVRNMEPNGDHGPGIAGEKTPDASPAMTAAGETRRYSRRALLRWAAGGAAAAASAGGLGFYVSRSGDAVPEAQADVAASPVSAIRIDESGGLASFAFRVNGKEAVYERGKRLPEELRDVRTVPLDGGSLTVIEPADIDGVRLRGMFLCAVPGGIFGYVDVPHGRMRQMGCLCGARDAEADGSGNAEPDLYLLTDTVFNARFDPAVTGVPLNPALEKRMNFDAASMRMLDAPAFETMHGDLLKVSQLLTRQTQFTAGASLNAVRPVLLKALSARNALRNNGVAAHSQDELLRYLSATDRFIVADESVVRTLRREPIPPEKTRIAKARGNSVCLPGVSPAEAQAMIRTA